MDSALDLTFIGLVAVLIVISGPNVYHFFAEDPDIHIKTLAILRTAQELLFHAS